MCGRRFWTLALALILAGALAVDAVAQRRDRDERRAYRGEWQFLGEKRVGFRVDRDIVRINQPEEWFRTRAFRRIHLVAEDNDIFLISVRLVYLNGYGEDFRVDREIRRGDDLPIDLRGDRSFLREIEFVYRSRPSFAGQATMKIYGEPSRRGPGVIIGGGGGGDRDREWIELGCKQVALFGRDRDTVGVGRREGRFRAIRLHVRGADVEMLDLRVIYANGAPDDIPVRRVIRQGDRTGPLDLRGFERSIDRVEMVYRTVPNFKGLATVCVEGRQ
jgi:hypothetical protein